MRRRTLIDAIFLTAVAAAGAWLRLRGLGVPSLWLDEIINVDIVTKAVHFPMWRWVAGFEPENGPLYFASELAGRVMPSPELAMRMAPALFGIATIVISFFALQSTARYAFALLMAAAPLHVYYSREGRPYALAMLLTTALLAAMLRRAPPRVVFALLLATAYTAASTAPLLGAACVAAFFAYRDRDRWLAAGAAAACLALVPLLYRGGVNRMADAGFPALTARSLRSILDSFSSAAVDTTHPHRVAFVFLALAIVGAVDQLRRDRDRGAVILAFALLPGTLAIAALWHLDHFFAIRYLAPSLPGYLLLVACGIATVVGLARAAAPVVAVAIALLLVRDGLDAAREEPFAKLDWRAIAATIAAHARPGDQVLATNDWTALSLDFYLRQQQVPVRLLNAQAQRNMALMFLSQKPEGWIVSAGYPDPPDLREAVCRFPVVRGEPLEHFRLHYVPALDHFLETRSTSAERRALLASYDGTIDLAFGDGDATLLDGRWGDPEPEEGRFARWVLGRDASIALPFDALADRRIIIDVAPVSAPGVAPQQLTLRLNDQLLAVTTLASGRHVYRIDAPRALWRIGANRLGLSFDHTTAPASLDRRSTDERPLAARFYRLTVLDAGHYVPPLPPPDSAHRIHLGAVTAGSERALPLPPNADPARLARFASRLGFDPQTTVPPLLRDEIRPAHLAMTLADDSDCLDDEAFLRATWIALLQRQIDPPELAAVMQRLRAGTTRREIVRAIANSEVLRSLAAEQRSSSFEGEFLMLWRWPASDSK